MTITVIVAVAENGVIGRDNNVPWHLPKDLKRFKELTTGHTVIMGRKTFDSIDRRPLRNRRCIIVTRNPDYQPAGVETADSVETALQKAGKAGDHHVFVAGGRKIYEVALALADEVQLTRVHAAVEGDVFFPTLPPEQWDMVETERHEADERHAHAFTFQRYARRKN